MTKKNADESFLKVAIKTDLLADFDQALKQITKARDSRARGKQLGTLGQGLLLATIERAERVATGHRKNYAKENQSQNPAPSRR